MPYALNFNGTGYVSIPAKTTADGVGFSYEFDFEIPNYNQIIYARLIDNSVSSLRISAANQLAYRIGTGVTNTITLSSNIPLNTRVKLRFYREYATTRNIVVTLNGAEVYRINSAPFDQGGGADDIRLIGKSSSGTFSGKMYAANINGSIYLNESSPDTTIWGDGTLTGIPSTNWTLYSDGDNTAPTFTVAPAASAIGQTSATVTATINETGSIFWVAVPQGDATPSVAQVIAGQNAAGGTPIDAGSAVATTSLSEVASGFTAATDYKFCVVAQDDEPTPNVQAAVTVVNFTTSATTTPITFTGTIPDQTFTNGQSVSVNLATYFTGTQTPFTFANTGTSLTGTGLSITSAGLLSGTATTGSVSGVIVTGTDSSSNTAASNAFNVTVNASATPVSFTGTVPTLSGTQNSAITPVNLSTYFSGSLTPFTYSLQVGTLPTGLTLNSSTGVISGTPTVSFSGSITVRATDTGANTADTNSFLVDIAAATTDGTITLSNLKNNTATPLASVSGFYVTVLSSTNPKSVVYNTASISSNASAELSFTDAAIVQGTEYRYFIEKDGVAFAAGKVTAT